MSLNNPKLFQTEWEGESISIETGRIAKQASGSVVIRKGDTMVLVTATASADPLPPQPFVPLTVNYQEQRYAAGQIPGGFFKREGRPTEKEILVSRLIDRPLRPLFPDGYYFDTQVIATVISVDGVNDPDVLAITGASAALSISNVPFAGPVVGVRVGRINGEYVLNPTYQQLADSDLDTTVVVSETSIVMVEGGADFLPEPVIVGALQFAFDKAQPIIQLQKQMIEEIGQDKREVAEVETVSDELYQRLESEFSGRVVEAASIREKHPRYAALKAVQKEVVAALVPEEDEDLTKLVKEAYETLKKKVIRKMILDGQRVDGRDTTSVRAIEIETSILPRAHGSTLFTRGETQAIVTATLGTQDDEQRIDTIEGDTSKQFYLHYNFPPYSVGETRFLRGPGRREIGHGNLAERAITPILPAHDEFPYTIRIVSDITESNGSSSMASVCGASLALMDAGVPIEKHIGGVAMGLISEGDDIAILTDILGDEDHLGDMDFKVAGSKDGITSFQMDIKIEGVDQGLLERALEQARVARFHIIDNMDANIEQARQQMSDYAPRLETVRIDPEKIGTVIGPGGKTIRAIVAETGAKIDIEEDGLVKIFTDGGEDSLQAAKRRVVELTKEAKPGEYYAGVVKKIVDFGAFVELWPGTQGLLHISEVENQRIDSVSDYLSEGEKVPVLVLEVDRQGKIRLSRKRAEKTIEEIEQMAEAELV